MKKYTLILFGTVLFTLPAQVYGYDGNAPLFQDESWKWVNINLIIFIAGVIAFIYVVRKLFEIRLKHQNRNAPVAKSLLKDNIYEPRYWYQCKRCRLTIRKDSPPKTAECTAAVNHLWTQMGEVGRNKYLCKNCNTLVETRAMPVSENCPDAETHNWHQLL